MRFHVSSERQKWTGLPYFEDTESAELRSPGVHSLYCDYQFDGGMYFSRFIVSSLSSFERCWLWPSYRQVQWMPGCSHLYYRFRQSYGDNRLLQEAPGHEFLEYETEDLASFITICIVSLWDVDIVTNLNYVSARLSHKGTVEFMSADLSLLNAIQLSLAAAGRPEGRLVTVETKIG